MRRWSFVLVILAVSLAANIILAVRLTGKEEPLNPAGRASPDSADRASRSDTTASLRALLEAERKRNEELRGRVEQLEAEPKAKASEFLPVAPKPDKIAAFREKMRKLMKAMKDPAVKSGVVDPETTVELTDTMMELIKICALRTKEPKTYADYLRTFYEVALEGEASPLDPAQASAVQDLFQTLAQNLAQVPSAPAGERLLKEIELEGQTMKGVFDLLTEPQRALIAKDNMNVMAAGNVMSTAYISKQGAADQIAQTWKQVYKLDDAQLPQAKAAAQLFVDAVGRIDAERTDGGVNPFTQKGSPEAYDYRLRVAREQLSALGILQSSMTPTQQERLRTQTVREIILYNPSQIVTSNPDK